MSNKKRNRNRNRSNQGQKSPQGARSMADADGRKRFTFKHGDAIHTLPPAMAAQERMPSGVLMDAILDEQGGIGELRLAFETLRFSGADPKAAAALREKPIPECMDILTRWMTETGTPPGESERSSS